MRVIYDLAPGSEPLYEPCPRCGEVPERIDHEQSSAEVDEGLLFLHTVRLAPWYWFRPCLDSVSPGELESYTVHAASDLGPGTLSGARRSGLVAFRRTLDEARAAMAQQDAPDTITASGAPEAR